MQKYKKIVLIVAFVFLLVSSSLAQSAYTPAKTSPERTAILNALRIPVEKDLKLKVQFSVDHFKSNGNWAFVNGTPKTAKGGKINYKNTKYQEAEKEGMFDDNFQALLKKTGGKWKVVIFQIGCTDVCYANWWQEYKAPKAVFPYTE